MVWTFLDTFINHFYVLVHFGGGITGVILIAFLDKDDGIIFKWDERSGLVSRTSQ